MILESSPEQNRLVCADCGAHGTQRMPADWDPPPSESSDPRDWEKHQHDWRVAPSRILHGRLR